MVVEKQIYSLFPTPVGEYHLECPTEVQSYIDTLSLREAGNPMYNGIFSENTYIFDSPECKQFGEIILQQATRFAVDVMNYDMEECRFTQSWLTVKQHGAPHAIHNHGNSIVSGCYYFEPSIGGIPHAPISFHKNPGTSQVPYMTVLYKDMVKGTVFSHDAKTIFPEYGTLLLWPSWLFHSVQVNMSPFPRRSIAFNVVPKHTLGGEIHLHQFKY